MESTDLCSTEDVLRHLGIDDDSNDPVNKLIERLITAKTTAITQYIGLNQILAKDYTDYYDGDSGNRIYTINTPINSITEINDDIEWTFDTDTIIDSGDYRISTDEKYILLKDIITTTGNQNVKVIYNAGESIIPTDLKQTCIEEVTRSYNEKLNIGVLSRTDAKGGTTRVEKGWMEQSIEVMDRYINRTIL